MPILDEIPKKVKMEKIEFVCLDNGHMYNENYNYQILWTPDGIENFVDLFIGFSTPKYVLEIASDRKSFSFYIKTIHVKKIAQAIANNEAERFRNRVKS